MNTLMLAVWLATLFLRVKVGRFSAVRRRGFGAKACKSGGVAAVCGPVAATFGTMENRRNGAQLVALHAARNAGVGIAAAFGAAIYVQLGKHAVEQCRFGTRGGNVGMAAVETRFPVPDARAVIEGRLNGNIADARAWSGLLVGSIVCYGILPRLLAWVVCKILLKTSENGLDLEKPIIRRSSAAGRTKSPMRIRVGKPCPPFRRKSS